jgi:hypothetical protein
MNETYQLIETMRLAEQDLKNEQLSPAMKSYMQSTDALIRSMQAYIDYLMQDDE